MRAVGIPISMDFYEIAPSYNRKHFWSALIDTTHLVEVTLYRKYPMRSNVKNLGNTCGVKIEGADTYDFMKPELLYEVVDTPKVNYNILKVNPKKKYRYIRYSAPKDKFVELAEWRMYAENISQPITPRNITADHPLSELHRKNLDLMDDNDWVSFYMSEVVGEQLIFDLGKPYKLDHILFMPRMMTILFTWVILMNYFIMQVLKDGYHWESGWRRIRNYIMTTCRKVLCCGCTIIHVEKKNVRFI